ncbi:MAG: hypothetical protein C0596_12895 [Marinilabiliales bacterium]|nr:MAG: hypothetical protein C0596_12895 [Marinilabiliales bacterium]
MDEKRFKYCREMFESGASKNLDFFVGQRYEFIGKHVTQEQKGVEFGAGAGLSEIYLKDYNLTITDICNSEWLDIKNVDAQKSDFKDNSFDYIIANNVIHHLDRPAQFFTESDRILKSGGKIVIIEPYSSFLMRKLLNVRKHEQVNYSVNPLDDDYSFSKISTSELDGNNAVAKMLFDKPTIFFDKFKNFELEHKSYGELFLFINSGGQYEKFPFIPLPLFLLRFVNIIDRIIVRLMPRVFALGIYIVIRKK